MRLKVTAKIYFLIVITVLLAASLLAFINSYIFSKAYSGNLKPGGFLVVFVWLFLAALFLFILLISVLFLIASALIRKPLFNLTASIKKAREKGIDSAGPVEVSAGGEIGEIAHTFNTLISDLKNSREEIRKYNYDLELMVNERTSELKKAYEKLRQTQDELIQSTKMASLGVLAGGIAHEINNPLTGVLNNVQLIRMIVEQKKEIHLDEFKKLLGLIEESALRCTKITRSLLDFSHASKGVHQEVSLDDLIDKVGSLVEQELKLSNIIIQKQLKDGIPKISGDFQLLQQVIFDIINNARWAIEKKSGKQGGSITIKTDFQPEKKIVLVSISDTGIGISKENADKLFEPFFTTKAVGEGTGLGLSIVYSIVKSHGGNIEVESELNQGTTFKISLPLK